MRKFILCLISILALVSCANHDIEQMSMNTIVNNYNDKFVEYVGGSIAPTQDWGFNTDFSKITTRGVDPNSNEWEAKGYNVPGPITTDERNAVLAVFNQKGEETYTSLVDWDCFFVQQVWKGTAVHPTNAPGQSVVGGNQMDWLCAGSPSMGDDHVNNFNNADGSIMLMVNSSTRRFGYKSSSDNGHVFHYFRMEIINGNYYVGFDFSAEGQNPNEQVARDLIYNDWIVKIVPGRGITKTYDIRVIAEDLNVDADTDFDFNDVVFDVAIDKTNRETWICLRAAGGTLPLTVDGLEVHNLFGVGTGTMVNTGWNGEVINWDMGVEVKLNNYYENASEIPIVVLKGNYPIPLYAVVGGPASKIGVPVTFHWCKERESIKGVYPMFSDWVLNNTVIAWW